VSENAVLRIFRRNVLQVSSQSV